MIAAAALAMTACGDKTMVQDLYNEPAEISFETFTEKQTKAENSGETDYTALSGHHTTFKVWAAKDATTHQAVYAAATPGVVTYSSDKWTADPLKFWDKTATNYYFYAAAPSDKSWAFAFTSASDMSDGTITLADYTLVGDNVRTTASSTATASWKDATTDRDLMIASPCPVAREKYNKATPDKVTLQFNHILSRLNVLVKKHANIANCVVSLKELKINNVLNKGSFNEKPNNLTAQQLAAGTIARWATPTSSGTYVPEGIALTATTKNDGVTTTAQYVLETLIIPQDITFETIDESGDGTHDEAYLYIKYSIDGEDFYGYYNLAKAFGATAANGTIDFYEGWQNNLTITINPATIEFDANVFNWDQNEDDEVLIPKQD